LNLGASARLVVLGITETLPPVNEKLRLVLLREIPEEAELRQSWDALVTRVDRPQVFYTYEWSLAVQRAYHASLNPLLFLAYDHQERLCGVAALAADTAGGAVSFLCANTGDYCDFLALPEHKRGFVVDVLAELRKQGIDNLTFTNLPADSKTTTVIRQSAGRSGYRCFTRTAYECAQVSLEKIERRPGENQPVLPRKKMLRRFLNAMGREAPVRLDHGRSWDTIEPLLPAFIEAHVARFLVTGRISNLARPERRVFLEELAKLLSESGWMKLTRLAAGEKNFAWNYGFQFQDTWFWYQPTFDSDLEKYSPGFCLLAKIIEEAAANPALKVVDLGLGAEGYKDRFGNQSRRTLCVTLRSSAAGQVREVLRHGAARLVKAWPPMEAVARAAASRVQRVREQIRQEGFIATASRLGRWGSEFFWSREEVFFFEWRGTGTPDSSSARLEPLGASQLASAASQSYDDNQTLSYLLRAAARLHAGGAEGFGLVDPEGKFLHFAWVTAFDGFFLSELNAKVDAPSPDCVMLFDCWTPIAARGHGYYAQTVARVAKRFQSQGKQPWIFSAARNVASLRGLQKSGFERRYSLVRRRGLLWQRIQGKTPKSAEAPVTEVSARV
jgi:CelD/BcsL family acetyltransferase involved in cellulose biosynthesis